MRNNEKIKHVNDHKSNSRHCGGGSSGKDGVAEYTVASRIASLTVANPANTVFAM